MSQQRRKYVTILAVVAILAALGGAQTTWAAAIDPGFDLLRTPPGGAIIDLGAMIPGLPEVPMEGNPIGPGSTDTIVERSTGLADGATGVIDVEIVALSLKSVAPVEIDWGYLGGTFGDLELFDVFVTLDETQFSIGEMTILTHDANGGTFDSFFDVFAKVNLVGHSFGPLPTQQIQDQLDPDLTAGPNVWSHTPPPNYPVDAEYPSGDFYPGVDPVTGLIVPIRHVGPHPKALPSPEPGTLTLLAFIGLAMLGCRWRRKQAA